MENLTPSCPYCASSETVRHGRNKGDKQRYLCTQCARTFVEKPDTPKGRPTIGDRPMTPAEKMRRSRQKKKGNRPN